MTIDGNSGDSVVVTDTTQWTQSFDSTLLEYRVLSLNNATLIIDHNINVSEINFTE